MEAVIQRSTVDAVPVLWTPAPAPARAGVVFRVGEADEDLPRRGVTRIVAEVAAEESGCTFEVGLHHTSFMAEGVDAHASLTRLAETLRWLPGDAAEEAGRQLRDAFAGREISLAGEALALRFGPTGPGLLGHRNYGFATVPASFARAWAETWFTASGAVLWCTGEPPTGFHFDLYAGFAPEPAAKPIAVGPMPAWTTHRRPTVAVSMLMPRNAASAVTIAVLERVGKSELDHFECSARAIDHSTFHVIISATGRDGLLPVLERVAVEGPTAAERAEAIDHVSSQHCAVDERLRQLAEAELSASPVEDDFADVANEVTAAEIIAHVEDAAGTALVLLPEGSRPLDGAIEPLPRWSPEQLRGTTFSPVGSHRIGAPIVHGVLSVSDEGVTRFYTPNEAVTVRFDDCAALIRWRNGPRTIFGFDGIEVHVDDQDWVNGKQAVALIDANVAPAKHVLLSEDANRETPPPPPPAPPAAAPPGKARGERKLRWRRS